MILLACLQFAVKKMHQKKIRKEWKKTRKQTNLKKSICSANCKTVGRNWGQQKSSEAMCKRRRCFLKLTISWTAFKFFVQTIASKNVSLRHHRFPEKLAFWPLKTAAFLRRKAWMTEIFTVHSKLDLGYCRVPVYCNDTWNILQHSSRWQWKEDAEVNRSSRRMERWF